MPSEVCRLLTITSFFLEAPKQCRFYRAKYQNNMVLSYRGNNVDISVLVSSLTDICLNVSFSATFTAHADSLITPPS